MYEWRSNAIETCLARASTDGKRGRLSQRGRGRTGAREGIYLPVSNGQVAEQKSTDGCCEQRGGLESAVMEVNVLLRRRLARASLLGNTLPPTTAQSLRHSHTQGIARGSGPRGQAARPTRNTATPDAANVMLENATGPPTIWCNINPYRQRRNASTAQRCCNRRYTGKCTCARRTGLACSTGTVLKVRGQALNK